MVAALVVDFWYLHMLLGGGNSNMIYFHHYLGKITILTHMFQMGWNHQLGWDDRNPPSLIGHHQDDITFF